MVLPICDAEAGTRTPPKLSVHNNPLAYEHQAHHNQSYAEAAQHQPAHGSSQAPEPTHDPLTKLEVSKGINIAAADAIPNRSHPEIKSMLSKQTVRESNPSYTIATTGEPEVGAASTLSESELSLGIAVRKLRLADQQPVTCSPCRCCSQTSSGRNPKVMQRRTSEQPKPLPASF